MRKTFLFLDKIKRPFGLCFVLDTQNVLAVLRTDPPTYINLLSNEPELSGGQKLHRA
jgi:hypothetical protein